MLNDGDTEIQMASLSNASKRTNSCLSVARGDQGYIKTKSNH